MRFTSHWLSRHQKSSLSLPVPTPAHHPPPPRAPESARSEGGALFTPCGVRKLSPYPASILIYHRSPQPGSLVTRLDFRDIYLYISNISLSLSCYPLRFPHAGKERPFVRAGAFLAYTDAYLYSSALPFSASLRNFFGVCEAGPAFFRMIIQQAGHRVVILFYFFLVTVPRVEASSHPDGIFSFFQFLKKKKKWNRHER